MSEIAMPPTQTTTKEKLALFTATGLILASILYLVPAGFGSKMDAQKNAPGNADSQIAARKKESEKRETAPRTEEYEKSSRQFQMLSNLTLTNYEVVADWEEGAYRQPLKSGKKRLRMYPFYILPSLTTRESMHSNLFTSKAPATDWEHAGIKGVGVARSIDFDKKNKKHLLMAGDSGLYHSYNFGNSWERLTVPSNIFIQKALIDPQNQNHYLIAYAPFQSLSTIDLYKLDMPAYVYESFNAGKTWTQLDIAKLAKDKGMIDSKVNFTGFTKMDFVGNTLVLMVAYAQTMKAGTAVITVDNGIPTAATIFEGDSIKDLTFANDGAQGILFKKSTGGAGSTLPKNDTILYKTNNKGLTWTSLLSETQLQNMGLGLENYNYTAASMSADGKTIYMVAESMAKPAADMLAKSSDSGKTWTTVAVEKHILELPDSYTEWKLGEIAHLRVQDLVIDPHNPAHLFAFRYMFGFYESYDSGKTWQKTLSGYSSMSYLNNPDDGIMMIRDMDLRFQHLTFFELNPEQFAFLLSTDQGLFLYDTKTHTMSNLAKDLYLAHSERVTVTNCPRVYAGLWHVGAYWINIDGSVNAVNTAESPGIGAQKDGGCSGTAVNTRGGVLMDGQHLDVEKTKWLFDQMTFEAVPTSPPLLEFHNGWWYYLGAASINSQPKDGIPSNMHSFVRINQDFSVLESIALPTTAGNPHAYYVSEGIVYLLTQNKGVGGNPSFSIHKTTNLKDWELYAKGPTTSGLSSMDDLIVTDKVIAIGAGSGLWISNDQGASWKLQLEKKEISDVVIDQCGNLYASIFQPASNMNYGGVYYSQNNGVSFSNLGKADNKVVVFDLEVDSLDKLLYAGTFGESLLRMDISNFCAK